jgi:Ca2+:H+ antiporter
MYRPSPSPAGDHPRDGDRSLSKGTRKVKYLNLLLIFIPLAIATSLSNFDPRLVFASAALGIIPLAGILGRATEELALLAGPRVGGLLNATLGNTADVSLA